MAEEFGGPVADPGRRDAARQGPGSHAASPGRRPGPPGGGLPAAVAPGPAGGRLVAAALRLGARAVAADSVAEALEVAFDAAGPDDLILVTGSLYVVGAARAALAVERAPA